MSHIVGSTVPVGWVVLKALLLYLTAVIGFRLGKRRTLAEMSAFDFVAAVAVGAIVGRVPSAHDAGYLAGAATLVTVLVAHWALSRLRRWPAAARLVDHAPTVLVSDGRVLSKALCRAGLTEPDLFGLLRQHGVHDLAEVQYVIFEQRGKISVIRGLEAGEREHSALLRSVT